LELSSPIVTLPHVATSAVWASAANRAGLARRNLDEGGWGQNTKEYDAASELTYMYQRWCDPALGIFTSTAPYPPMIEHPYTFAEGNPVSLGDPRGELPGILGNLPAILKAIPTLAAGAAGTACAVSGTPSMNHAIASATAGGIGATVGHYGGMTVGGLVGGFVGFGNPFAVYAGGVVGSLAGSALGGYVGGKIGDGLWDYFNPNGPPTIATANGNCLGQPRNCYNALEKLMDGLGKELWNSFVVPLTGANRVLEG